jgi:hypothetical protein
MISISSHSGSLHYCSLTLAPKPLQLCSSVNTTHSFVEIHPVGCWQSRYHVFGPALQAAETHEQEGPAGAVHTDVNFAAALCAAPSSSPLSLALQGNLKAPPGWRAAFVTGGKELGGCSQNNGNDCCDFIGELPQPVSAQPASLAAESCLIESAETAGSETTAADVDDTSRGFKVRRVSVVMTPWVDEEQLDRIWACERAL